MFINIIKFCRLIEYKQVFKLKILTFGIKKNKMLNTISFYIYLTLKYNCHAF